MSTTSIAVCIPWITATTLELHSHLKRNRNHWNLLVIAVDSHEKRYSIDQNWKTKLAVTKRGRFYGLRAKYVEIHHSFGDFRRECQSNVNDDMQRNTQADAGIQAPSPLREGNTTASRVSSNVITTHHTAVLLNIRSSDNSFR